MDSEFYQKATEAIFKDLDSGSTLEGIMEFLNLYMPVDAICIAALDGSLNRIIGLESASSKWPSRNGYMTLPQAHINLLQDLRKDTPPTNLINDVNSLPEVYKEIVLNIMPENSSLIRLSLKKNEKNIGSLFVHALGNNKYSDENVILLSSLRAPLSLAFSYIISCSENIRFRRILEEENALLKKEFLGVRQNEIVGSDFGLKTIMEQVRQVGPTDSGVLLLGETGVGKEIIANAIHNFSQRRDEVFVKVNCGAIPESIIDSELFGHEKGAFTGALKQKKGRFERADGGTLFLDEIGELPLAAQVRLLRILQHQTLERVGGTESISVNVRIISATNRDLAKMVEEGSFREDLFYRLNIFPIRIPPLRERLSDIPALVSHFIAKKQKSLRLENQYTPSPGTIENMMEYPWPGNVRELENVVERELIRSSAVDGERHIHFGHNAPCSREAQTVQTGDVAITLDQVVIRHIETMLLKCEGKISGPGGAAELLGINPSTLRARMKKMGIRYGKRNSPIS